MKVSIITCSFNEDSTIAKTIESVISQDYPNIEYIIIDGNSSDDTVSIVESYRHKVDIFITETDNGIYDAMNKGIRLASGQIIGCLNANDYYSNKHVISRVVEAISNNNTDSCYGDLEYVGQTDTNKTVRKWLSGPYKQGIFKSGWHPPHPTFFVKKDIYELYGHFDLRYAISADYELMLRLLEKHRISTCYIPEVLIKMKIGGKSNKNLKQIIKANIECYKSWQNNDLKISPLIMLKKPASKLLQYIKK